VASQGRTKRKASSPERRPSRTAFLLSSLGYHVGRRLAASLEPLDLEPRHFAVLNAVATQPGQSQQALAAALQIPPSRMVAILDDLERRGLVERRSNPSDRRVRALHLTPGGTSVLTRARRRAADNERRLLAALHPDERERLHELLERVAGANGLAGGAHPALRNGEGASGPGRTPDA
jgi:DNA-binding MarR family transcriptional regulator